MFFFCCVKYIHIQDYVNTQRHEYPHIITQIISIISVTFSTIDMSYQLQFSFLTEIKNYFKFDPFKTIEYLLQLIYIRLYVRDISQTVERVVYCDVKEELWHFSLRKQTRSRLSSSSFRSRSHEFADLFGIPQLSQTREESARKCIHRD